METIYLKPRPPKKPAYGVTADGDVEWDEQGNLWIINDLRQAGYTFEKIAAVLNEHGKPAPGNHERWTRVAVKFIYMTQPGKPWTREFLKRKLLEWFDREICPVAGKTTA